MAELMLTIRNNHFPECGAPPVIDTATSGQYVGYFANRHAEQWVFTFDRQSGEATLRGGDLGWDQILPVHNGQVDDLILDTPEQLWLAACWSAATLQEV
jgi:hypothetical protein